MSDPHSPRPEEPECEHRVVVTFAATGLSVWACSECGVRFYPACRECVDVGHRGVAHVQASLDEYYVARHSNDAVRVDEAIIDVILAASTPTTPGEPAGTLDEAWAEAEAALPEGWVIRGLAHGSPADETEWVAAAGTMPFWETPSQVRGYGSTPNAALRALAVNLDGAFRLRDHEGVAREQADSEEPE